MSCQTVTPKAMLFEPYRPNTHTRTHTERATSALSARSCTQNKKSILRTNYVDTKIGKNELEIVSNNCRSALGRSRWALVRHNIITPAKDDVRPGMVNRPSFSNHPGPVVEN